MLNTLNPPHHTNHCCFHTHSIKHLHPSNLHRLHHQYHRHSNTRIRTPHYSTGIFHTLSAIDKQDSNRNHQNRDHDEDYDADKYRDRAFYNRIYKSSPIYLNDTPVKNGIEEDLDKSSSGISSNMWWADLKAAVGQRVNVEGLLFAVSVITKHRHWVIPHVSVPDVRYIDWAALKRKGFEGVVFDKDNTLTVPYSLALWGPIVGSVESCKSVFGNNIAVFSNSAGLQEYDPDGRKARALEFVIGIRVIRHKQRLACSSAGVTPWILVPKRLGEPQVKKPAGSAEEIERHFGCDSSKLIMVGDRPFTDIVYGNRNGFLTILTAPLSLAEDPFIVKQVRKIELALVNRWSKKGLKPANERLLSDALDCVKEPPFV